MIGLESEKGIHILPMEERHIVELARLEAVCSSSPWSEEGLRAELQSETAVFLVAEQEGRVLGYAGMHMVCGGNATWIISPCSLLAGGWVWAAGLRKPSFRRGGRKMAAL